MSLNVEALSCCAFIVSSSTGVRKRCGGGETEGAGSVAASVAIASWSRSVVFVEYLLLARPLFPSSRFEKRAFLAVLL